MEDVALTLAYARNKNRNLIYKALGFGEVDPEKIFVLVEAEVETIRKEAEFSHKQLDWEQAVLSDTNPAFKEATSAIRDRICRNASCDYFRWPAQIDAALTTTRLDLTMLNVDFIEHFMVAVERKLQNLYKHNVHIAVRSGDIEAIAALLELQSKFAFRFPDRSEWSDEDTSYIQKATLAFLIKQVESSNHEFIESYRMLFNYGLIDAKTRAKLQKAFEHQLFKIAWNQFAIRSAQGLLDCFRESSGSARKYYLNLREKHKDGDANEEFAKLVVFVLDGFEALSK